MHMRIKQIRKHCGLTQAEFGSRIGVKGNTITGYETGLRTPSDAVLLSICREFHVNPQWLREGQLPVFLPGEEEDTAYINDLLNSADQPFYTAVKAILQTYSHSTPEDKKVLDRFAENLLETIKKENRK